VFAALVAMASGKVDPVLALWVAISPGSSGSLRRISSPRAQQRQVQLGQYSKATA
jgi:hypothetical protein